MTIPASVITASCPVRTTLEMLGGKWLLLLLQQLTAGGRRFSEIRQLVPDISEKVLMQELQQLTVASLIRRTVLEQGPARISYHLTPLGQQAMPVLAAVAEFGLRYAAHIRAEPLRS